MLVTTACGSPGQSKGCSHASRLKACQVKLNLPARTLKLKAIITAIGISR